MSHPPTLGLRELASLLLDTTDRGHPAVVLLLLDGGGPGAGGHWVLASPTGVYGSWGGGHLDLWAQTLARDALRQACEAWGAGPMGRIPNQPGEGHPPPPEPPTTSPPALGGGGSVLAKGSPSGVRWRRPGLGVFPQQAAPALKVFLEVYHPQPEWLLVGGGHLAHPLCALGTLLGYRVVVLDDRPDFARRERFPEAHAVHILDLPGGLARWPIHPWSHVVLITRAHQWDAACLRAVLGRTPPPAYVGMIGSRRRIRTAFRALLNEGIPPRVLEGVHAPVGLDLNAETPAEIALAVAAEILLTTRGGTGTPLREKENVLAGLLAAGAEEEPSKLSPTPLTSPPGSLPSGSGATGWRRGLSQEDRAVYEALRGAEPAHRLCMALVVEALGSTPRGVGAKMLVDGEGRVVAGTVGGGWGEAEVLRAARESLRTGQPRLVSLSLTAREGEGGGSVCGGHMEVWVAPAS